MAPAKMGTTMLVASVAAWYAASAVANSSTKQILRGHPSPLLLTVIQLGLASMAGAVLFVLGVARYQPMPQGLPTTLLWKITLTFTFGFLCVNACFVFVEVSLGEVTRAAEPLFALVLTRLLLRARASRVTPGMALALVPIVVGVAVSAMGAADFSGVGIAFSMMANVLFGARAVYAKAFATEVRWLRPDGPPAETPAVSMTGSAGGSKAAGAAGEGKAGPAQAQHQQDQQAVERPGDVCLFFHICARGAVVMAASYVLLWAVGLEGHVSGPISSSGGVVSTNSESALGPMSVVLVNSFGWFVYNQMSFVVLSNVHVITHAVANGMRRVVTILASVAYFGNEITTANGIGICIAVVGVLGYARAKAAATAEDAAVAAAAATSIAVPTAGGGGGAATAGGSVAVHADRAAAAV